MLYGAGQLAFTTQDLGPDSLRGQNLFYPGLLASFELSADSQLLEAKALIDGKRQIVAAAIGEETFTLKTTTQYVDWHALQFGYDELAQVSTGLALPTVKVAKVPATTPFTVVDTDISTASLSSLKLYAPNTANPGERIFLEIIPTGTPASAKEVSVDAVTGTITFHSSLAGKTIQYVVNKAYASVESIGAEESYDAFGKLSFIGLAYGTAFPGKVLLVVPELSRVSTPTISVTGDITELSIDFRASVPAGSRKPFALYNLSTGTFI